MDADMPDVLVGRPNLGDYQTFEKYVRSIWNRRWLSNDGPLLQDLEQKLKMQIGVRNCILVANGTLGLQLALRGIGVTGEVIVPSFTFVATVNALVLEGLRPVFADINALTHNVDPSNLERLISSETSAVLATHLWGRPADIQQLSEFCKEHNLKLIFDAAHAFGVKHPWGSIGTFGDAEVFSFHATKVFNTFEGGMITTNNDELATQLRLLRNFGFNGEDNVEVVGTNAKMSEINAAMGLTNLLSFDEFVSKNKENFEIYIDEFKDIQGLKFMRFDDVDSPNFQYVVAELSDPSLRDPLWAFFRERGIYVRRYFNPGVHRMKAFKESDLRGAHDLPITEEIASKVLVFPTGTQVDEVIIKRVASACRDFFQSLHG